MSNQIGIKILQILKRVQKPLDKEELFQNLADALNITITPEFKKEFLETLQLGVDLGFIHIQDGKYLVKPPKTRNESIFKRGNGEGDGFGGMARA